MAAIGSVWGTGTWTDDIWASGTWGDAAAATTPPTASSGGGGGGGSTQNQPNRRADFDVFGKSRRQQDEPKPKPVEKIARENADAIIENAQEIAREKAALNAMLQSAKRTKARERAIELAEAKIAKLEADAAILQDDEEVLLTFIRIL